MSNTLCFWLLKCDYLLFSLLQHSEGNMEVVLCILHYFNNQNPFLKHKHFIVIKHLKLSE